MTVARPDDRCVRGAEQGEMVDGVGEISLADVAEHATEQDQVGRNSAPICVGDGGIADDRLNAMKARYLRGLPGKRDVALVKLHEPSDEIIAAGMVGERSDQVMALTGTNPDRSNCTRRGIVEHRANLRLYDREPAAECGIGVRVVSMPRPPVHVARETTTRRDRPSKVMPLLPEALP